MYNLKIPKKNKSKVDPDNMLEEVSNTITGQKNILKGEMVNVIDKKLNEKISNQQNETGSHPAWRLDWPRRLINSQDVLCRQKFEVSLP